MYLRKIFVLLLSLQLLSATAFGQDVGDSKLLEDSVADMYTVAGAGLGGAIIGLSTLSFVEEPGDHLKNILVGAALGIMGGVAFVGYSTANKGRDLYYDGALNNRNHKDFSTKGRVAWHRKEFGKQSYAPRKELPFFVWSSQF